MEQACLEFKPKEAEEMRAEMRGLRKSSTSGSNLSKEKMRVLKEVRQDKSHVILTVDKGVALVVLDTAEYIKKTENMPD